MRGYFMPFIPYVRVGCDLWCGFYGQRKSIFVSSKNVLVDSMKIFPSVLSVLIFLGIPTPKTIIFRTSTLSTIMKT